VVTCAFFFGVVTVLSVEFRVDDEPELSVDVVGFGVADVPVVDAPVLSLPVVSVTVLE
jgi:hypothetical protein